MHGETQFNVELRLKFFEIVSVFRCEQDEKGDEESPERTFDGT